MWEKVRQKLFRWEGDFNMTIHAANMKTNCVILPGVVLHRFIDYKYNCDFDMITHL